MKTHGRVFKEEFVKDAERVRSVTAEGGCKYSVCVFDMKFISTIFYLIFVKNKPISYIPLKVEGQKTEPTE